MLAPETQKWDLPEWQEQFTSPCSFEFTVIGGREALFNAKHSSGKKKRQAEKLLTKAKKSACYCIRNKEWCFPKNKKKKKKQNIRKKDSV